MIFRENLFEGKTALVTGGGSGIGLRMAGDLLALGARVVISGRNEEKLKAAEASLANSLANRRSDIKDRLSAVPINIRDEESVAACVKATVERSGGIDLLINNAGGQFPAPAEKIAPKGWRAVIETNLTGTFLVSREVYIQSMESRGGVIVNILMNMWNGFPLMAHSGAARAGADNLTKSLALEWGRKGVRVNAVAPGIIQTSGLDTYDPEFRKFVDRARKNNQSFRLGTEAEVSAAALFLLSPAAAYISGETLRVDCGESLYSPLYPPVETDRIPPYDPPLGE